MEETAGALFTIMVLAGGGGILALVVCLIIAPLHIWKYTHQTADAVAKLTATQERIVAELERLNAHAAQHSNADAPCPQCGKTISLEDGRGKCQACGQLVKA